MHSNKVLSSLITLAALVVSIALTIGTLYPSRAMQPLKVTAIKDYPLPRGFDPWGTAFDSSGNVWVAAPGCDPNPTCNRTDPPGILEEFNPSSSSWTIHSLPSGYAQALFLTFDTSGHVWFPLFMDNTLGVYNPGTNSFHQYTVPTSGAGPWDVAVDHNGKIWFTEHFSNKIGRFDPVTHTFKEISTPAPASQPYGITVDANNNIWFTENNSADALIGEYTTAGKLLEYKIRNTQVNGLTPHLITVDPNGNIWWSEGWVGEIGELKVSQAVPGTNKGVTEYQYKRVCGSCSTHTSGISVDHKGKIWFDDSLQSIFGSFPYSGTGSFALYHTPTSNSHPHDGMNVDGQNRVWFDEEFANKLARAIQ